MIVRALLVVALLALVPVHAGAQIVITEILYNAASSEATNETQYVEIANVTGSPVDLTGWEFGDSQDDDWNALPPVTLPPFGIAVLFGTSEMDFTGAFGTAIDPAATLIFLGATMTNLSNSPSATNETVAIRDDTDTIIDEVNYDDSGDWPGDPGGFSIYLAVTEMQLQTSGATLNDDGTNWSLASDGVDGAVTSTPTGLWNAAEVGSPGNFDGGGFVPVELFDFSIE